MAKELAGLTSGRATVNGIGLHYWLGGDPKGLPVLLWHGFLTTGYAWREIGPALARAGCSVLIPDMRGYGDSDKPEGTKGYDARSLANEARELAKELQFDQGRPIILAAHDMGAVPALIWTADHPEEVATLVYIEAPVMLGSVLSKLIAFTPEAMREGSMWWWILPFAPGVPEKLIVGNERAFLTWFYERHAKRKEAFTGEVVDEYLRTFSGREGVLGSMGIYRAAFENIAQTEPLTKDTVQTPVIAVGGIKGLGSKVGEMVRMVAANVKEVLLDDSGHFVPDERPEAVTREILALTKSLPAIAS